MALITETNTPDQLWMSKALELAQQALGQTSPNPLVGCVIVSATGELVGSGFHRKAGQAHAEIFALAEAGERARGASLYVNLEPCCHFGKTPPCVPDIVKAGVKRVVIGVLDPSPQVNGSGIAQLQTAGIEVVTGCLERECLQLNRFFLKKTVSGLPWVTLKLALSLNGLLTRTWSTGEAGRQAVQALRAEHDIVLTGSGTILADNPQLNLRDRLGKQPLRVILDRRGRLERHYKVFEKPEDTLVYTECAKLAEFLPEIKVKNLTSGTELVCVLEDLAQAGHLSVLVEAGSELSSALLDANLIDELKIFYAPLLQAPREEDCSWVNFDSALFQLINSQQVGGNTCLTLRRKSS